MIIFALLWSLLLYLYLNILVYVFASVFASVFFCICVCILLYLYLYLCGTTNQWSASPPALVAWVASTQKLLSLLSQPKDTVHTALLSFCHRFHRLKIVTMLYLCISLLSQRKDTALFAVFHRLKIVTTFIWDAFYAIATKSHCTACFLSFCFRQLWRFWSQINLRPIQIIKTKNENIESKKVIESSARLNWMVWLKQKLV